MPRKIITVTLHTAIDVVIEIPSFSADSVIQANSREGYAGGKGINVARFLEVLGEPVVAVGLVGTASESVFSSVASRLVRTRFVSVAGSSRQNITLIQTGSGSSTHIRTAGCRITPAAMNEIRHTLRDLLRKNDIVVFSGSIPPGAPARIYRELITMSAKSGASVVLDTSGPPLRGALTARPHMVKVNLAELEAALPLPRGRDQNTIVCKMGKLVRGGIPVVAVSLGSQGVLVLRRGDVVAVRGRVDLGGRYAGHKAVGSGDAMLAGFTYAMKNDLAYMDMIRWGAACGGANVLASRPDLPSSATIRKLVKRVTLDIVPLPANRQKRGARPQPA